MFLDLKNKQPKILVIGDLILDKYLWGDTSRISPEAPVQIVDIKNKTTSLGGAGNVVKNLIELNADIGLISVTGNCNIASDIKSMLVSLGVNTKHIITEENRQSSVKTRIISSQQQVVRYDLECKNDISIESENKIINLATKVIKDFDLIILSDYAKGVLTPKLVSSVIKIAKKLNVKVIADPKGKDYTKYSGSYLLTPNKKEVYEVTNIQITDDKSLLQAIKKLKKDLNLTVSLITLSEKGIATFDTKLEIYPAVVRNVFDVTGAGDTVISAIGYCLACGYSIDKSAIFANLAAGVVVGKIGSATANIDEIINYSYDHNFSSSQDKIKSVQELVPILRYLKKQQKTIVFTNGCFDLLHAGHINYLEKAREYGDVLILGLNSDSSVKLLKGNKRPIINELDRAYLLSSLRFVDYVVIFNEETPINIIKSISPNILIKGGDYKKNEIIGSEFADETIVVPFIPGKSTSNIIKDIVEKYENDY